MVQIGASIGIKAMMETADVERGTNKIKSLMDGISAKGKELSVFFRGLQSILKGLVLTVTGFGAGLIGILTGAVAMSPHFRAFLAGLQGPWMKLQQFLGTHLKPLFDVITKKVKEFVDVFTTNKGVREFFDKWIDRIKEFLENISKEDMKKFLDTVTTLADKTITFTIDVMKGVWGIGEKIWDILTSTENKIEKTLGFEFTWDTKLLLMAAAAAAIMGYWPIAAALLGGAGASAIMDYFRSGEPRIPYYATEEESGGVTRTTDYFPPQPTTTGRRFIPTPSTTTTMTLNVIFTNATTGEKKTYNMSNNNPLLNVSV